MSDKLKFIFSVAWTFLYPIIEVFITKAGIALAEAALDAVKKVQKEHGLPPGDIDPEIFNQIKHKEAFMLITEHLARRGLYIGASFVNVAIIAAVKVMNKE